MITDRDICIALGTRNRLASELTVREVACGPARTCRMDDEIQTALQTMREGRMLRLPVINGSGGLVGVICMDDVVLHALRRDGANRPCISYEDVMNTLRAICLGHTQPDSHCSVAA
jgi:CBS-domain-containing membrane protein